MPKNIVSQVKVNVPRKSAYDKSFKNILTTMPGTITPIVSKLLIPNSDFSLKLPISAALPPLASDTFMRCQLKLEAFAVPLRLLYGGFEAWLTGDELFDISSGDYTKVGLPLLSIDETDTHIGPGSLADYLGVRISLNEEAEPDPIEINIFKFLAYHRVYDDWYRNRKIEKPLFSRPIDDGSEYWTDVEVSALPYMFRAYGSSFGHHLGSAYFSTHGTYLYELHQRNYGDDYFTVATSSPQAGNAQKVTVDASSQFTISALRAANSLQQFAERNNLGSPALQDYVRINYGASLSQGVAQRAVLLGSAAYDVYSKGINATSDTTPISGGNPFGSVGARYGQAFANGDSFFVKGHVDEPCYLMVMATLVPEANYSFGISRDMLMFTDSDSQVDIPVASLENTGNEPIYTLELNGDLSNQDIFGYVPRYFHHKTSVNEVHGQFIKGQSLASFVSQRNFEGSAVEISTSFLKIPITALDNVAAVQGDISKYGVMIDCFVDLKVSEPLSESELPSLQDPAAEHGYEVTMQRNGSHL